MGISNSYSLGRECFRNLCSVLNTFEYIWMRLGLFECFGTFPIAFETFGNIQLDEWMNEPVGWTWMDGWMNGRQTVWLIMDFGFFSKPKN